MIKEFEGLRLKAYQDSVGVWTIGYGHTKGVTPSDEITELDADRLLWDEMRTVKDQVYGVVTVELTNNQMAALISFTFNLGIGNLSKSTLLKCINAKKSNAEIYAEWNRWTKAGGVVLPGLVKRREAEAKLFIGEQ